MMKGKGYTLPPAIMTSNNEMLITFHTDVDNSLLNPPSLRPGRWQATYTVDPEY